MSFINDCLKQLVQCAQLKKLDIAETWVLIIQQTANAHSVNFLTGEEDLRLFAGALPALIALFGPDGRCRFANRAFAAWTGLAPGEIEGRDFRGLMPQQVYEDHQRYIAAALGGKSAREELRLPDCHGQWHDVEMHYLPMAERSGLVSGFCVFITTIGQHKQAERRLAAQNAVTRALSKSANLRCRRAAHPFGHLLPL